MQRKNTLPHAMLLRGRAGIGKHDFALSLSQALLCQNPDKLHQACGICPSCQWFAESSHPDFRLIAPETEEDDDEPLKKKSSKKNQISIAQIRQLFDYLSLSSHQVQGRRLILISPAEALNGASANALLKMLEEPPINTFFLLVCSQPQRLLATIVSRCQSIDMPLPSKGDALTWLKTQGMLQAEVVLDYAGGSPLLALQTQAQMETTNHLIKQLALGAELNPFVSAPLFMSIGMERALDALQKWIFDLVSFKFVSQLRFHTQQASTLQALSKSVNLSALLHFQQSLVDAKKTANHPLNNEMQLENVLLQYTRIFSH
ncbi:MAG: DNA polymerase III subunit delta' [Methylophilaceae bacterium]